jgi:glycine cleavage system H protein
MATPNDRRYTDQHEWALVQGTEDAGTVVRVGITDHAQDALGDIVFVQLPEVGDEVGPGSPIGEVESTKSVSDIYAPVSGTVVAVNSALGDTPETINADPYGEGWLVEISVPGADGDPTASLLDAAAYQALVDASCRAAGGLPDPTLTMIEMDTEAAAISRRPTGPNPECPVDPRGDLLVA